jgi:tryptophan synthase alpha chain
MNRIDRKFAELGAEGRKAFIPFITAGDPTLGATERLVGVFDRMGASIVELGVPFSDPIADGPTIQASYTRVLDRGQTLDQVFKLIAKLRRTSEIPIVTMVSYSIVYRRGVERYVREAAAAGADGAIVPDLAIEEADRFVEAARRRDLKTIFLVSPETSAERARRVAALSTGFVYCQSVRGITGARESLAGELVPMIKRLRKLTDKPLCVGFGISKRDHAARLREVADGVIVGSALIREIARRLERPGSVERVVGRLARSIMSGLEKRE